MLEYMLILLVFAVLIQVSLIFKMNKVTDRNFGEKIESIESIESTEGNFMEQFAEIREE